MKRGLEWYKREPQAIRMAIMAARMTAAQAAIYNLVIDLIYEGGGETPNEPQHIAAHFSDIGTAKARTTISELIAMGKLFVVGSMLHEKRAENQAKTRRKLSETRAEIGRIGGVSSGVSRAKTNDNNDMSEANASSKHEAERERDRERDKKEKKEARENALSHLERVVPHDLAEAFVAHRKALKAPMTPYAGKLMAKKLATMSDPGAAMEASIEAGWRDVFPPKPNIHPFPMKGPTRGERYASLSAELDARLAERPFD